MNDLERLINRRLDLETIVGRQTATSVSVHGVYIPANSIISRLHHFGQNLVRFTHSQEYEVQLIGSATGIEYRGSRIIICTEHQVRGLPVEDVGIVYPEEKIFISSAGYLGYQHRNDSVESDARDLRLFDFTKQTLEYPKLSERFFKFREDDFLDDGDSVIAYMAYGCPFVDQNYDIFENNRVDTIIRSMLCEPQAQPADAALGACRMRQAMDFDPNGLSGGPVFATILRNNEVVLKFAGIISRAGGGNIHFVKAMPIKNLLNLSED